MSNNTKRLLRDYGIFTGIILFMFVLLFFLTLSSRKNWNNGLKQQVSTVLSRTSAGTYIVGDAVPIKSMFSVSAACYRLLPTHTSEIPTGNLYAVIMRVTTIYGPLVAVFVYDDANGAKFESFACMESEDIEKRFVMTLNNSQLAYWEKQIPVMLGFEQKKFKGAF